ncbi:MAG: PorV/PorQ family protein [Bacteroidetes bacterium]|nr:PorV/PorQ family protein [Bacteroidota bacterium]
MSHRLLWAVPVVLAGILAGEALGQDASYHGTSAANVLKLGLGARAAGMGDSYISMAEDASCLSWNPGAASRLGRPSLVFSHLQWFVETSLSYAAVSIPLGFGTVGLDMAYFSSGDIQETTLLEQDGTGRVVSASDLVLGLTYSRQLTDRFSAGLKVKFIREGLASVEASTIAFDVGSVFVTSFPGDVTLGMALSNFGGTLRFDGRDLLVTQVVPGSPTGKQVPAVLETADWPLPLFFRFGLSATLLSQEDLSILAAYSITDARDYEARHNLGTAITILKLLTLRGGYRFNYDEATFSAGAGVAVDASALGRLSFDYAYMDYGDLKGVHQFSISILVE